MILCILPRCTIKIFWGGGAVFPSGQVDFQLEKFGQKFFEPKNFLPYLGGFGGMLPLKSLKILLLKLARIAFVASFPPILFIKSLFFKNFWNNSKFHEKFNFPKSSVRKTIFRESHGSSGRLGRTVGGGVMTPSKPPSPTKNLLPLPTSVLKCFWKDPLMIPSTPTTPLQASFPADPPLHPPPLPP